MPTELVDGQVANGQGNRNQCQTSGFRNKITTEVLAQNRESQGLDSAELKVFLALTVLDPEEKPQQVQCRWYFGLSVFGEQLQ